VIYNPESGDGISALRGLLWCIAIVGAIAAYAVGA
jgi:hypothetical protein